MSPIRQAICACFLALIGLTPTSGRAQSQASDHAEQSSLSGSASSIEQQGSRTDSVQVAGEGDAPRCAMPASSYQDMVWTLSTLARQAPEIARLENLGTSVLGRPIVGLRISDNIDRNEMEPEARIVSAIHGDERISHEVAISLAIRLVKEYPGHPEVAAVVDGVETLIVPMLNPDGVEACTRVNANGIDLNRNFAFMQVEGLSPGPAFSEPETRTIRDDALSHPYVLGISYHCTANYLNLLWNYSPNPPRHVAELVDLMETYRLGSGYDLLLGWYWYSVNGEMTDWSYGTRGMLDTIIEIQSDTNQALHSDIHVPRAITLLASATRGLAGRVTAADSGEPLNALVWVNERRMPVYTEPINGDFHTVLLPGEYSLSVYAPGYEIESLSQVSVTEGEAAWIEVRLQPGASIYALALVETVLPQEISSPLYLNGSVPTDSLGPPDGFSYILEPSGEIVLDLGLPVLDHPGFDLRVVSGSSSPRQVASVLVSSSERGPWLEIGKISGTRDLDLAALGLTPFRFVRLVDCSPGMFGLPSASFNLDAIEVIQGP